MMLELNNVSFTYAKNQVLRKVSLFAKKNEIVGIVGPSGSGKTTLFHLISGLLKMKEGEILINGLPHEEQKHLVSYLLQEDLLLPWKTVLENILLVVELRYKSKKEWEPKALILLDEVGLLDYADYYPHELSGGMRQRVSLARALILEPSLLLLDEPFAAIDSFRRESLYDLCKKIRDNHLVTILLISHQMEDVAKLADRYYTLIDGEITQEEVMLLK